MTTIINNPNSWISISALQPRKGVVVETKIDDDNGARNVTTLMRRGRLWFLPDGSMYHYYTPTHWREVMKP